MRTKNLSIVCRAAPLIAAALVAGAPKARAADAADVTLLTGSVLGGGSLVLTHSQITVTVETYAETMPWPGGNHEPFQLGKPTELYTLTHVDPVANPTVDNLTQVQVIMAQFMQPLPNVMVSRCKAVPRR